ncbi:MAG: hypothetical protein LBK50_02370 [Candidatus Nomurabacteria bacterium]|jgi:hypothetical protein|nr:hypothetical protein [Candidatus Nomurabacteria bacterium]
MGKTTKCKAKNVKTTAKILAAVQKFIKSIPSRIASPFRKMFWKNRNFRGRRPHRSLRRTDKIAKNRSLKLPSYIAFTNSVWKTIWRNKGFYIKFFLLFCVFSVVLLGVLDQETYVKFRDSLNSSEDSGSTQLGFLKYFTLAASAITSSSGSTISEGQRIIGIIMFLLGWLMLVWALRQILAGHKPKLRDSLYSAGSPMISTLFVIVIGALQLLPLALSLLAYQALTGVGIINSGIAIENMAFWLAEAFIVALTLYWMVPTFFALVIVTLPGMYPFAALKNAGDRMVGRRLRFLYRIIYMALPILLLWLLVLVPIIILDNAIQVAWLPLVPLFVLLLTTLTIIWCATYIYLLYRKVLEDDAKPVKK